MKLKIVQFEPSSKAGEFELQVPKGSVVLMARITRMGEGNIVLSAPVKETGETETIRLCALWEDYVRGHTEGIPSDWRHLGCWSFDSGDFQHLFIHEPAQELKLLESDAPSAAELLGRIEKLEQALHSLVGAKAAEKPARASKAGSKPAPEQEAAAPPPADAVESPAG